MTAITDLTFNQLSTALNIQNALFVAEDPLGNISLMINIAVINGDDTVNNLTTSGVVKLMTRLIEACHKAQETVNTAQPVGEMLDAFPSATSTGAVIDGYVQQTSFIKSRIAVSSATVVIGATA